MKTVTNKQGGAAIAAGGFGCVFNTFLYSIINVQYVSIL
jgi:hypothetical protein